jgi:hypothetical protein
MMGLLWGPLLLRAPRVVYGGNQAGPARNCNPWRSATQVREVNRSLLPAGGTPVQAGEDPTPSGQFLSRTGNCCYVAV